MGPISNTSDDKSQSSSRFDGPLRREIWIHPEGGRRIYRTASMNPNTEASSAAELAEKQLTAELNSLDQLAVSSFWFFEIHRLNENTIIFDVLRSAQQTLCDQLPARSRETHHQYRVLYTVYY